MVNKKKELFMATMNQVEENESTIAESPTSVEVDCCNENIDLSYDWNNNVFEEMGKRGLKGMNGEVLIPAIYDDCYVLDLGIEQPQKVCACLNGKVALVKVDGVGTPITDFEFSRIEHIPCSPFYAVWKEKDKVHFALMCSGEILTPYEIESCDIAVDDAILLWADGKTGIMYFGQDLVYIKPEYDEIYDEGVGNDFIFIKDGVEGRMTLDGRFVSNEEYNSLTDEEYDDLLEIGWIQAPEF